MKFYTFDELTYPGVPPEVGPEVRFTNRFCDPRAVTKTYHEHLDEWAICEELGFDGAFVNEHHFTAINIQPSCNITATAIIMRTKRMKVGVIGNILSRVRSAVAGMARWTDSPQRDVSQGLCPDPGAVLGRG
jgi:Luciferase-like monooxygenase